MGVGGLMMGAGSDFGLIAQGTGILCKVYKYRIGFGLHKYIWWSLKVFVLSSGQIVKCQEVVIRSWI